MDSIAGLRIPPRISSLSWLWGFWTTPDPYMLFEYLRLQQWYGSVFRPTRLGNFYAVLGAPEMTTILKTNAVNYTKDHLAYRVLGGSLGRGILVQEGPIWRERRRQIAPHFQGSCLRGHMASLQASIDGSLVQMASAVDSKKSTGSTGSIGSQGKILNMEYWLNRMALEIAAHVFFDAQWGSEIEGVGDMVYQANRAISGYSALPAFIPTYSRLKLRYYRQKLFKQVQRVFMSGDVSKKSLVARLRNYEGEFRYHSDLEILEEVMTVLLTGHETTASALIWALCLLESDPDYKQQVLLEIDTFNGRMPSISELDQCWVLKMWIQETLRLYPPIWAVIRRSVEEDNLNGYYIPAQSIMMCHIFGLHRNPEYWSDPNTFDPYRFAPDNIHKQVPNSFLPFSTGLRLCIASQFAVVEMQMILIRLLQHFRISALPGQRIEMDPLVTLKTRTPVHLCVERR